LRYFFQFYYPKKCCLFVTASLPTHLLLGCTAPRNLEVLRTVTFFFFKGLVAVCHSFCLFFIFYSIHTIIQSHSYNTLAEASLHLFIASKLSGTDLPVVPSRDPCGAEPRKHFGTDPDPGTFVSDLQKDCN
jgi:hypothetical protein